MDAVEVYKKRIRTAVRGLDRCRYTLCGKCPYRGKGGCRQKLFTETADLLDDYLKNLKGFCEDKAFEVPE